MTQFSESSSEKAVMDRLAFLCLCLFAASCVLLGRGTHPFVGPVRFRLLLFAVTLLCSIPSMLRAGRSMLRGPILLSVVLFLLWIALCGVRGLLAHNNTAMLLQDVKGFAYFALLPVMAALLDSPRRRRIFAAVLFFSATLLALLQLFAVVLYSYFAPYWKYFLRDIVQDYGFGVYSRYNERVARFFMVSCPYLMVGSVLGILEAVSVKGVRRLLLSAAVGLQLFALLVSFSRAVYLGTAVTGLGALIFLLLRERRRMLPAAALCVGFFLFFTAGASLLCGYNLPGIALSRVAVTAEAPEEDDSVEITTAASVPKNTEENITDEEFAEIFLQNTRYSDMLRASTLSGLKQSIREKPLFGHGLGTIIPNRPEGTEYFYLELTMKTGLVGLILNLLPTLLIFLRLLSSDRRDGLAIPLFFSLLGFSVISYFNPYMNALLGIFCYSAAIAVTEAEYPARSCRKQKTNL